MDNIKRSDKIKESAKESDRKLAGFFSVLADETRLKILMSLIDGPKTVNGIHSAVGKDKITLSAISHQLKQLNDQSVVAYNKKGREKYFELSDEFCWCILRSAVNHFKAETKCRECSKKSLSK